MEPIKQIYFGDLGFRHPINEQEQIIWYLKNYHKTHNKNMTTRFFLNLKEKYQDYLNEIEAFEIIRFLNENITIQQEKNRQSWKIKQLVTSEKELLAMKNWKDKYDAKRELLSKIGLN